MTTAADVRRVLRLNPELGNQGFGDATPVVVDADFVEQVEAARLWVTTAPGRSRSMLKSTSYACKHRAESWAGRYLTNSALIVAAALAGYDLLRMYHFIPLGRHCRFRRAKKTEA